MMMNSYFKTGLVILALGGMQALNANSAPPTPQEVKAITQKVADWQIETFEYSGNFRGLSGKQLRRFEQTGKLPNKYADTVWHMGALYAGMNEWRKQSGDPEIKAFLMNIGERNDWKLHRRPYHADDHTVGQLYLSLYEEMEQPEMIQPTQERFDWILENRKTGTLNWKAKPTAAHDRWGWCDALFMAPPVWARLAKVTGDAKYLRFMDEEYRATYDILWDDEAHLFYRDSRFIPKTEQNGKGLFWSRGNGWVIGGLALMIPDLPDNWEGKQFYEEIFQKMAAAMKAVQRPDGTWSMGLLGDIEDYPTIETSGSAFITYGLAWGVNYGLLDEAEYTPTIYKGWNALTECVDDKGMLGYVQPVGGAPGDAYPDKTEVYGIGAFLAAGAEVYQLVGGR